VKQSASDCMRPGTLARVLLRASLGAPERPSERPSVSLEQLFDSLAGLRAGLPPVNAADISTTGYGWVAREACGLLLVDFWVLRWGVAVGQEQELLVGGGLEDRQALGGLPGITEGVVGQQGVLAVRSHALPLTKNDHRCGSSNPKARGMAAPRSARVWSASVPVLSSGRGAPASTDDH
jgi:hypothetical protein